MNKSDWKTHDPVWIEAQERKWPYFRERIEKKFENYPEGQEENLKLAHDFLVGNITELPDSKDIFIMKFNYQDWILLHPNPTQENIILILEDFQAKGYVERKPFVYKARELSGHCEDLVEAGVVDGAVVEAFMNAVYGYSIEDTIKINNLNFDEVASEMLSSFLTQVSAWVFGTHILRPTCLRPIDRWVNLSKDLLLIVKDQHVEKSRFRLKKFFRLLANFESLYGGFGGEEDIKLDDIPEIRKVIFDFRAALIGSKSKYCLKLQEYISVLEERIIVD